MDNTEGQEKAQNEIQEDPYAYLNRGQFSSENFKIEVKNMPKYYGIAEFRRLLNEKLKLNVNKVKVLKRNSPFVYVCFRNEEDRSKAIKVISEYVWKGKSLQAMYAKPSADPLVKKRKNQTLEDSKRQKTENNESNLSQADNIKNVTTPLAEVTYTEQLEIKQKEISLVLEKLGKSLIHQNWEIKDWIDKQKQKYNIIPCELLNIRHTDSYDGYRNKCEFTIGIDKETTLPIVGFRIGAYVDGVVGVAPVDHLRHIPDEMKKVVKIFEKFLHSSNLEVYNPELQTGHFRQLCVRSAPNQLMVIVGINPQNLNSDEISSFKNSLMDFFREGPGRDANVTSLYYQELMKKIPGSAIYPSTTLLMGEPHIIEKLLGLEFRISPESFFQVNTKAAEILYNTIIELAEPTLNSTMIDVCCGTGTIGLCFAKSCSQILGLEVLPEAIANAKQNALLNNIQNSEFFVGKAEDILGSVCFKATNEDVFAVIDPPRAGMHSKAIQQIRKITKINRLVYVSCNPHLAMENFVQLCRPESKSLQGEFFVPVKAVAVDLFPHTKHCELVICFKRWSAVNK